MEDKRKELKGMSIKDLVKLTSKKKKQESIQKVDRSTNVFPLSCEQSSQWFMQQFAADCIYNVSQSYLIEGKLDITPLEKILNTLVQRHEIMRTIFTSVGGMPSQVIKEHMPVKLLEEDLRGMEEDAQMERVNEINKELFQMPFNISVGPLWRFMVIRLRDDAIVFSYALHHIISDGWSLGVLIQDILSMYSGDAENIKELPPLSVQYVDYSQWQHEQMNTPKLKKQLEFWKSNLEDVSERIHMPYCVPRDKVSTHKGDNYYFDIPKADWEGIGRICNAQSVTSYHVMLSVLFMLLHHYSKDDDICIGTPVANRNKVELENLIGLVMNTVVVRSKIDSKATYQDYLQDIKQRAVQSFENAEIPFEKVIEELNLERQSVYNPVFQVLYVQMDTSMMNNYTDSGQFQVKTVPVTTGTAQFDLSLYVTTDGTSSTAYFEYNADLFTEESIGQLAEDFVSLLHMVVQDDSRSIEEYENELEEKKTDIVIASSFVIELLSEPLEFWINKLAMPCGIQYAPYSQIFQQLTEPDSVLRKNNAIPVIFLRLEDWVQGRAFDTEEERKDIKETLETNTRDFIYYVNQVNIKNLRIYLCQCSEMVLGNLELNLWIHKLEKMIKEQCLNEKVITMDQVVEKYELGNYLDTNGDKEWHIPYKRELFIALGTEVIADIFREYTYEDTRYYEVSLEIQDDEKEPAEQLLDELHGRNATVILDGDSGQANKVSWKYAMQNDIGQRTRGKIRIARGKSDKDSIDTLQLELNKAKWNLSFLP